MRVLVVTLVGVLACGWVVSAQGTGDAAKGKVAYAERKCGLCHKTDKSDEKGGKMATVLADTAGKLSAADIKRWLTDTAKMEATLAKKPPMPMSGYLKNLKPPLGDAEVANLVAYIQTLSGGKPNP